MSRGDIQRKIAQGPLLFDGAMGTYYVTQSKAPATQCEFANRTEPALIGEIHRAYIDAGCRAIKTNTFGLAAIAWERGLAEAKDLLHCAWAIAQESVADRDAAIFADFGPPIPGGEDALPIYQALVDEFLALGATNFLFETFSGDELIRPLAAHIRGAATEAYLMASFAVSPDGFTPEGRAGGELVQGIIDDHLADAAGFNCVSGPGHLLPLIREMDTARYPLSLMPNAGYPTVVGRRTVYGGSGDYFAARLREMADQGVAILGGCCGTTPEYMRKTVQVLRGDRPPLSVTAAPREPISPTATEPGENRFREKLMAGQRVVAVELDSPLDCNISKYMEGAKLLQSCGADVITIADCPVARSRMDSSIVACKLRRELGIDALPHLTCRDRNLNATRALLLGLSAEGVHNVLIVTGDPVPTAERDAVKSVYNFNARMLAKYIQTLNEELFQTPFLMGGALNVNAKNFNVQLGLAREKVENGVELLLTQPIMTRRGMDNLRRAKDALDCKILGGIMPIVSYRNAQFIAGELQGMEVDPDTVERYRDLSKADAAKLGVELSLEIAGEIATDIDGYYLITPFQRTDMMAAIMEAL